MHWHQFSITFVFLMQLQLILNLTKRFECSHLYWKLWLASLSQFSWHLDVVTKLVLSSQLFRPRQKHHLPKQFSWPTDHNKHRKAKETGREKSGECTCAETNTPQETRKQNDRLTQRKGRAPSLSRDQGGGSQVGVVGSRSRLERVWVRVAPRWQGQGWHAHDLLKGHSGLQPRSA